MLHTLCDKDFNDIAVGVRNISASLFAIPTRPLPRPQQHRHRPTSSVIAALMKGSHEVDAYHAFPVVDAAKARTKYMRIFNILYTPVYKSATFVICSLSIPLEGNLLPPFAINPT